MNRKISVVLKQIFLTQAMICIQYFDNCIQYTAKNEFRQWLKMIQTMTVCDTLRKQMVLF
jgi:hypothetical protein